MDKEKFVFLDYTSGTIFVRDIPEKIASLDGEEIAEHFASSLMVNIDDGYYMIGRLSLDIQ